MLWKQEHKNVLKFTIGYRRNFAASSPSVKGIGI
jgi:hypothetical protein